MNLKVISRNVGFALLVSALFMFLSIIVSVMNGNDSALAALSISFVITFIVGIFPFIFVHKSSNISLTDGYMIIFLSWLLSFIFGMLPYVLWGGPFSVTNAWFESVSGFTTTGATILMNVEELPKSLLFWRSSTHFIGGLGVVVFLLLIIPMSAPVKLRLTNMEVSSLSKDGYRSRANKTVWIFTSMYLAITLLSFLCYLLAGMTPFEALNHAFSVSSTGGFSTRTASIGGFNSGLINWITVIFMFLASVHFGTLFSAVAGRTLKPFRNPIFKFYFGTIAVVVFLLTVSLGRQGMPLDKSFAESCFHVVSYASSTGFAITDNTAWPVPGHLLLMWVSIMCGMAGSTTGGMKSDRVLILFKSIIRQVRHTAHPSRVKDLQIGRNYLKEEDVFPHLLYIAIYGLFIIVTVIIQLFVGVGLDDAMSGTIASIGNVGLALNDLGPAGNYSFLPAASKFIFSLNMFLGRLEIYPILAVMYMMFRRRRI